MAYRAIITDVTNYGPLFCVAGWDFDHQAMIRPEPAPASFWDSRFVGENRPFWPGHIVTFEGHKPENQPFRHATEDIIATMRTLTRQEIVPLQNVSAMVAGSVSPDLDQIFRGGMQSNLSSAFVAAGTQCPSLGAIELAREDIKFAEKSFDGKKKLRCWIPYEGRKLNFGITSDALRTIWRKNGLNAIDTSIDYSRVQLRIGLARAMANGNACYVQVNGIYQAT
jgi:hypothetical protein